MKKINSALTIIIAVLIFQMISSTFNQQYHLSSYDFATQDKEDDLRVISLSVSTETFKGSQEAFVDTLINYLEVTPYDVSVLSVGEATGYEEAVDRLYVKSKDSAYSHLYIKGIVPQNSPNNHNLGSIITNYDENRVQIIQPFRFDREIRYDGVMNKLEHKSLHDLNELVGDKANFIVNLNFFVPNEETSKFQDTLRTEYFNKYFACEENQNSEQICGLNVHTRMPVDIRNFEWKLFDLNVGYPLLIMLVSCISLITIIIYQEIKNKKEIIIRKMHGNSEWVIFLRLLLPLILQTLFLFVLTLILLFIICYEGPYVLLKSLLHTLLKVSLIFSTLIAILVFALACIQRITNKGLYLKREARIPVIYFGNIILKVIVIVMLSIPLVTHAEHVMKRYAYQHELNQMTNDFDQAISSVNYGYEFNGDDELRMNQELFHMANENDIAYINFTDIMRNFENSSFSVPVEINTVAFKLLFPEIQDVMFGKDSVEITTLQDESPFLSQDAIRLDKTPDITTPFYTWGVLKNPSYRLVLNPSSDDLNMINFMSLYTTNGNAVGANQFFEQVSQNITNPEILKLQTLQSSSQKVLTRTLFELTMKVMVIFLLIFVYSKLLIGLYLNSYGKHLTIQYLHGVFRAKRYAPIYMHQIISIFMSSVFTVFILLKEVGGMMLISVGLISLYFIVILIFDLLLIYFQLRKFERKSVVVLKGDQS